MADHLEGLMEGRSEDRRVDHLGDLMEGRSGDQRVDHLEDRKVGRMGGRSGDQMEGQRMGVKAAWRRSRRVELLPLGKSTALLQQRRRQAKKRALTA